MTDNRSFLSKKIAAVKRLYMWHYASKKLGLILVSEYPKSGGTWYCQMLAEYLQLPYPRNRMPKLEQSILHGHSLYSPHFNNPVCVVRDGRDIMVSFYHHMYFGNSIMQPAELEKYRSNAPFNNFENIKENMPAYIEYMFTKFSTGGSQLSWSGFIQSYLGKENVVFVQYEKLLAQTETELENSIKKLMGNDHPINKERLKQAVEKYSFETVSKRKKGEESKADFLRKGVAGDWKNYFSKEACETFNRYAGKELVLLGYEKDEHWF